MVHYKQNEVKKLVEANINVLLEGPAGSGKSTILKNVANMLELDFYTVTMTKQTTLNALLGFLSINGTYIPSQLRQAVEFGGLLLLDEIDAGDPNVLLCLNSLENGYLGFPDKVVQAHEDFRLCAASNPSNEHQKYTGRSKLDAATLDRFDIIYIDRDDKLEALLTSEVTAVEMSLMRKVLANNNISKTLSMRDAIRYEKRKKANLHKGYTNSLLNNEERLLTEYSTLFEEFKPKEVKRQEDCINLEELWDVIIQEHSNNMKAIVWGELDKASVIGVDFDSYDEDKRTYFKKDQL